MLSQNNSGQELLLQIRRSMRQGDVDAVYLALSQSTFTYAEEICHRFKMDVERFQNGDIDAESWCLEQIRSFNEILNWPEFKQSQEASPEELDKKLLDRLVNSFELDKAFQLCESLGDSSILMQAQYNILKKLFHEGKIEVETWELIRHSTQYQLWELSQSKETTLNFFRSSVEVIKKWFRVLFR